MKINKIYISGFGCYRNEEFTAQEGINEFCIKNGGGKTTLTWFLVAMFYGLKDFSDKKKFYAPREGEAYGGSIEFSHEDKNYRIERHFCPDTLRVIDMSTGFPMPEFQDETKETIGFRFLKVDSETFMRSLFIGERTIKEIDRMKKNEGKDEKETVENTNLHYTGVTPAMHAKIANLFEEADLDSFSKAMIGLKNYIGGNTRGTVYYKNLSKDVQGLETELRNNTREAAERRADSAREAVRNLENEIKEIENEIETLDKKEKTLLEDHKKASDRIAKLSIKDRFENLEETLTERKNDLEKARVELTNQDGEFREFGPNELSDIQREISGIPHFEAGIEELYAREKDLITKKEKSESEEPKDAGAGKMVFAFISLFFALGFLAAGFLSPFFFIGAGVLTALTIFLFISWSKGKNSYNEKCREFADEKAKLEKEISDIHNEILTQQKADEKLQPIRSFFASYGLEGTRLSELQENFNRVKELDSSLKHARDEMKRAEAEYQKYLDEHEEDLKEIASNENGAASMTPDDIEKAISALEGEKSEKKETLTAKSKVLREKDNLKNQSIKEAGEYIEKEERLAAKKDELTSLDEKNKIHDLTVRYLTEAKEQMAAENGGRLIERFQHYLGLFFPQENDLNPLASATYYSVDANGIVHITANGVTSQTDILSSGYRDITYFCLRMALVDLLYGEEKVPLILDEPFLRLDDHFMEVAKGVLSEIAQKRQVFYFTCRESERINA